MAPGAYRDEAWIAATWVGNDWITVALAAPLLVVAIARARSPGRPRALALGVLAYVAYNYTFYLFGARLNAFFPLYLLAITSAAAAIAVELKADLQSWSPLPAASERLAGAILFGIGTILAAVWMAFWAGYALAGRPTPIEPEAFKVVAATDLLLLVPTLLSGGWLLLRRHRAGQLIGAIAAVQGGLYLLVLTVNSALLISMGLADWPGELPVWGPLLLITVSVGWVLFRGAKGVVQR
jgi:hypothetical protein